jgi:rhodanese-related sulfurtransferase
MLRKYLILTFFPLLVGLILIILPQRATRFDMDAAELARQSSDRARFVTTDGVAEMIIDQIPGIILADLRDPSEFDKYTLPGAINIPFEKLLDQEYQSYLDQDIFRVIFFGYDDLLADQAWQLCLRMGYKNKYIMEGGLNRWAETILEPKEPPATASSSEFSLYSFRSAASQFFRGVKAESETGTSAGNVSKAETRQTVPVVPKKKKTVSEGGC